MKANSKVPLKKGQEVESKNPPNRQTKPKPPPIEDAKVVEAPVPAPVFIAPTTPPPVVDPQPVAFTSEVNESNNLNDIPKLEISKPPIDQNLVDCIGKRIHNLVKTIRMNEYKPTLAEDSEHVLQMLNDDTNEYQSNAEYHFELDATSLIRDLLEEFYYLLNNQHIELDLLKEMYLENAQLVLPNSKEAVVGRVKCSEVWKVAYKDIQVHYIIDKIDIDTKVMEDKLSPLYDAFVTVHGRIIIENDTPRKIMELFQWKECRLSDQDPVHKSNSHEAMKRVYRNRTYNIQKHVFVCLDARPLYCFHYYPIPKTKYRNWEPHLRPIDYDSDASSNNNSPHSKSPHDLALVGRISHTPSMKSAMGDDSVMDSVLDPLEEEHSEVEGES